MIPALKKKILVIDNDRSPRESLRILLNREFEVYCAETAAGGLDLLQSPGADLVITDTRMPDAAGIEDLLSRIRASNALIPVIVLSGDDGPDTAAAARRHGASDYLKKPFEITVFLKLVREHLVHAEFENCVNRCKTGLLETRARLAEEQAQRQPASFTDHTPAGGSADGAQNPLSLIEGYLDLMADQLDHQADASAESCSQALSSVRSTEQNLVHCDNLIRAWEALGGKIPGRVCPLDVADLLKDTAEGMQTAATARNVLMEIAPSSGNSVSAGHVLGDRVRLVRLIQNLAANAIDAVPTDGSGRIRIGWESYGGETSFTVEDNGCGIAPEIRDRILEPYYSTKPPAKGAGMGLFTSQKIIAAHHGRLRIESTVGRGSRFTVFLTDWHMVVNAVTPAQS